MSDFEKVLYGAFFAVIITATIGNNISRNHAKKDFKMNCLELNLGKETCDKIFKEE